MTDMDYITQQYNHSLAYIANGDYEQARILLEQADREVPGIPLLNRILGYVEIQTGYPHYAVTRWNRFSLEELVLPKDRKEWAESLLPQYDTIYERYNYALEQIHKGDYDAALKGFEALIARDKQVALPVRLYRGYFLLLARTGSYETMFNQMDASPDYVKMSREIRHLRTRMEVWCTPTAVVSKPRQSKVLLSALAASVLLIMGLLGTVYVMSNENTEPLALQTEGSEPTVATPSAEAEPVQTLEKNDVDSMEIAKLNEQVKVLDAEKATLETELKQVREMLSGQEKVRVLSGTSEESLTLKAANQLYNSGFQLFKQGRYKEAEQAFAESGAFGLNTYYADDNLYYWMESLKKQELHSEAAKLYDRFLNESDPNYLRSPYLDDVLLFKAEYLLESGEEEATMSLLEKLVTDYPKEWTADRARYLIKKISTEGVPDAVE